ncbi:MAG: Hsp20/alpha crystallin family protein [Chloroflexi bacterium]|nr:Hsp20/alpha crystallin family protein [Chloroflexota bacterium]
MTLYLQTYPARHMARRWAAQPRSLNVNIREEDEAYLLSALVPGLSADDLNIQVLEDVVRIEGVYKADESAYLMRELPHGVFTRTLRLPTAIEAEQVEADITNGVLTLRLPKAESARPRKIKVNVN